MGRREIKFKNWDGSKYISFETARKMTLEAIKTSTEKSRDEGVKNLANSSQWFELLPDVIEPEKAGRPVRVISPEEYLALATGKVEYENIPPTALVVDGHLELHQKREMLFLSGEKVALPEAGTLVSLPPAIIRGDLRVHGAKSLREIQCAVTGVTVLQNCPALEKIQGECFGFARFAKCGMKYLAAGYRCAGDLRIQDCKNLRVVNCEVGGNLTVSSSPLERTGAALQVGGELYVMGNGGDLKIMGRVGSRALYAGVEIPVGGLSKPRPVLKNSPARPPDKTRL